MYTGTLTKKELESDLPKIIQANNWRKSLKSLKWYISIILFLIFLVTPPISAKDFLIQNIDSKKEIEVLNTPKNAEHTWWVTTENIDPVNFSKTLVLKKDSGDVQDNHWKPALVPGNPISEKLIGTDVDSIWYLKVFFISEIPVEDRILYIKKISDRDETYLNGIFIGKTGDWDAEKAQAYDKSRLYSIPKEYFRTNSPNVLLVRARKYFRDSIGIWGESVFLGTGKAILRDYYFSIIKPIVFLVSYFTVGSYFIFLFIRMRRNRDNFFFGFFSIAFVVYQFLRNQWRFEFPFSFYQYKKLEFLILISLMPALYLFIRYYFIKREARFLKYLHYLNLISILSLIVFWGYILFTSDINLWNDILNKIVIPFLWPALFISVFIIILYNAFFQKDIDAKIMLLGWLLLIAGIVNDSLVSMEAIRGQRITEYTFFVFILSLAFILSNRFVRVHKEVEDLNLNLEQKVIHRTEELQTALTIVNELKQSQDGDYFLTYLLLEPLSVNAITNPNIKVDFFISQKKKFTFKKYNKEIGGDTCIAHTVSLQNRTVTIFLNADAMGKSMQGAGGILVLNSIFESIVQRTMMTKNFSDQTPQNWLSSTFVELHNVFIMFEGSMMVSLIMGVIDDATGRMFYINAEHPPIVLFRDEKAIFIESEFITYKLGAPNFGKKIVIETFSLEHKDILVFGSDGRDDIVLPNGEMNDDSDLFLNTVENAKTDLLGIYQGIQKNGNLYDDLSLLRIEYNK